MPLRKRSLLRPAFLLIMLLGTSGPAEAQRTDLDWDVMAPRGFEEGGIQVVFGPTREIDLRLTLVNEDASEWATLEPSVFDAVNVQMVDLGTGLEVPVTVRWREDARCLLSGMVERCLLALSTALPPRGLIQPVAVLVPSATVEFSEGEYAVRIDFTAAKPLIRGAGNEQWGGRVREDGTTLLVIRAISSPSDRRQYYRIEGGVAMIRGDFQRVLELSERWIAEFPDEPQGYAGVGHALLEQRQFEGAARMFERALAVSERGPGTLLVPLATTYIAIGQEARAVEALQRYVPAAAIPRIVQAARQQAMRIQVR
jgi:hypothetical protein